MFGVLICAVRTIKAERTLIIARYGGVERIKFLASVFSIDVCAYAVMSNHYHLVLFINQDEVDSWGKEEVIARWAQLFPASTSKLQTLLAAAESDIVRKSYEE